MVARRQGAAPVVDDLMPEVDPIEQQSAPPIAPDVAQAEQIIQSRVQDYVQDLISAINEVRDGKRGNVAKTLAILSDLTQPENEQYLAALTYNGQKYSILSDIIDNISQADPNGTFPNAFSGRDILEVNAVLAHNPYLKAGLIRRLLTTDMAVYNGQVSKEEVADIIGRLADPEELPVIAKSYSVNNNNADIYTDIKAFSEPLHAAITGKLERYQTEKAAALGISRQQFVMQESGRADALLQASPTGEVNTPAPQTTPPPAPTREDYQAEVAGMRDPQAALAEQQQQQQQQEQTGATNRRQNPQFYWVRSPDVLHWLTKHPEHAQFFGTGRFGPDGNESFVGENSRFEYQARQAQNRRLRELFDSGVIEISPEERRLSIPTYLPEYQRMQSPFVSQKQYDSWVGQRRAAAQDRLARYEAQQAQKEELKKQTARENQLRMLKIMRESELRSGKTLLTKQHRQILFNAEMNGEMVDGMPLHVVSKREDAYRMAGLEYVPARVDSSRSKLSYGELTHYREQYERYGVSGISGVEKEFFANIYYKLNGTEEDRVNRGLGSDFGQRYGRVFTEAYQKGFVLEVERLLERGETERLAQLRGFVEAERWPLRFGFSPREIELIFNREADLIPGKGYERRMEESYLAREQEMIKRFGRIYFEAGGVPYLDNYIKRLEQEGRATEETIRELQKLKPDDTYQHNGYRFTQRSEREQRAILRALFNEMYVRIQNPDADNSAFAKELASFNEHEKQAIRKHFEEARVKVVGMSERSKQAFNQLASYLELNLAA